MIQLINQSFLYFLGIMEPVKSEYNKRLILLSVIQLSGGHCNSLSQTILCPTLLVNPTFRQFAFYALCQLEHCKSTGAKAAHKLLLKLTQGEIRSKVDVYVTLLLTWVVYALIWWSPAWNFCRQVSTTFAAIATSALLSAGGRQSSHWRQF